MYVLEARDKSAKGNTGMNAKELIRQVNEQKANDWRNSDLYRDVERLLEKIAQHYETCEDCRQAFDDTEYEEETLKEMEAYFINDMQLNVWTCDEA